MNMTNVYGANVLDGVLKDITPYMVRSLFLALRSSPNACNWCQAQAHENG